MSEQLAYFTVVRVWFNVGMRDPHVQDANQYHHGVFVRTRVNGSGILHHAVGDVTSPDGMRYEARQREDVISSQTFHSQETLGYIPASYYPALEQVLQKCQTPPQQKTFNKTRMATEPFKSSQPFTFYTADELKNFRFPRLRKCKWWVENEAIPAIRPRLLIQIPANTSSAGPSSSYAASAGGNGNNNAVQWVWDAQYQRYKYLDGQKWVWQ